LNERIAQAEKSGPIVTELQPMRRKIEKRADSFLGKFVLAAA
jgi:hypothetical protein